MGGRGSRRAARDDELIAGLADTGTPATRRVARQMARREAVRTGDPALRRALAESYRRSGNHSQAGRWGVTQPGWASPRELRDLRRWLLGAFSEGDYVRIALGLPSDREVPPEINDLVAPEHVPTRPTLPLPDPNRLGCVVGSAGVLAGLVSAVLAVAVVWRLLVGGDDLAAGLRLLVLVVAVSAGIAGLAGTIVWMSHRTRGRRLTLRQEPSIDPLFATSLAGRLAEDGDERGAVILLKRALAQGIDPDGTRRALVALSRAAGRVDQAGRWAIGIPGLATEAERRGLVDQFIGRPHPEIHLRHYATLGWGSLGPDPRDVLRRVGVEPAASEPVVEPDFLFARFGVAAGVIAVATALGYAVAVVLALQDDPAGPVVARWVTAGVPAVLAIGTATYTRHSRRVDPEHASPVAGAVTAGILAATAGALATWTLLGG